MKSVTIATCDTRNFSFTAAGKDMNEAKTAILKTLIAHGKQYELPEDWFADILWGGVNYEILILGQVGCRDREPIMS